MKELTKTIALAAGGYVAAFLLLLVLNGILASGISDQEYGRSTTLAAFTVISKVLLAMVIGFVVGRHLSAEKAAIAAIGLMSSFVALAHLLPGGALLFAIYADDIIWQQGIAVLIAGGVAWCISRWRSRQIRD